MTEVAERLGRLEAQHENSQRATDALVAGQQELREALRELSRQVAELTAALRFPDPAHCCQRREIAELWSAQRDTAARATALEHAYYKLLGAIAVLLACRRWYGRGCRLSVSCINDQPSPRPLSQFWARGENKNFSFVTPLSQNWERGRGEAKYLNLRRKNGPKNN